VKKPLAAIFPILCLALSSCGISPEQAVIGNWQVDTAKVQIPGSGAIPGIKDRVAGMLGQVSLKLEQDKTFSFVQPMAGAGGKLEGTWELTDKSVRLKPKSGKEIELAYDPNEKTLTLKQSIPVGELVIPMYKTG